MFTMAWAVVITHLKAFSTIFKIWKYLTENE